ncbi:FtsX-like permease family protein, partial [uncultured Muribaculum sp.]|uniref:FtsX-like permease family protein n=1 Tax=uncultured Muribaculum sp. TaxID=1918613 RepID=UPI002711EB5F
AGVMRSFGATPSYIVRMMLGEGWMLTTVAWVVGCFLYLQYALAEGLAHTHNTADYYDYDPSWTSNFGIHFTVVSLVVYVMLLIVVTIGISIPASRISRVKPVDALRDE